MSFDHRKAKAQVASGRIGDAGVALAKQGLTVRLEGALTSELLWLEALRRERKTK